MDIWYYLVAFLFGLISAASFALTLAGFTASGIASGSIAASVQSAIGEVAAGSLFAYLQSLGASGVIAGTRVITGGTAAAMASIAACLDDDGSGGDQSLCER
jgi:Interferon-induced 6-16 family